MTKHFFIIAFSIFLLSCGSNTEQNKTTEQGLIEQSQTPDTVTKNNNINFRPSEELQKTIDSALLMGYIQNTKVVFPENRFGLVDPISVFSTEQEIFFQGGQHVHIEFVKGGSVVRLDEYVFATNLQAFQINEALTKPLADKTKERFFRYPLTFFPFENRMYYISTTEEQYRAAFNEINGILVRFL